MALQDKSREDCSAEHALFATYLATFIGLQRLHRVSFKVTRCTFPCNLCRTVGKRNPLQGAKDMLHVEFSICNLQWLQTIAQIKTQFYRVQSLKAPKVARHVEKRACYMLQPTCNSSRNAITTQVAKKIAPCNTSCRARVYFLQQLRRFLKK